MTAYEPSPNRPRPAVCAVFDDYMTRKCGRVGHDHFVSQNAVVGDVRLGHDEAIITGFCQPSASLSAPMNGDKLADAIASANLCFGRLAREFQILGR